MASENTKESIGGRSTNSYEQLLQFNDSSVFRKAALPVGHIYIVLPDGTWVSHCTGLAISDSLVLTAKHCLFDGDDPLNLKGASLVLGQVKVTGGVQFDLKLDPVDIGEGDNDFVILQSTKPFGGFASSVPPAGPDPLPNQELYIFHHPSEQPLVLSRLKCRIADEGNLGAFIQHTCDTEPGSSGAPIMNENFEVVGIHTGGGKTAQSGTYNQGLVLSKILELSEVVRVAMKGNLPASRVASEEHKQTVEARITLDTGSEFRFIEEQWFYVPAKSGATDNRVRLKQQRGGGDMYVFWDPTSDTLYEVPKGKGMVRAKRFGEATWSEIGEVEEH